MGGNGATPVITAARGASNLFQTPDGRIFAFSNGAQPITPGQLFQVKLLSHCLKITQNVSFRFLAFSIFVLLKVTCLVRPQASGFQKIA